MSLSVKREISPEKVYNIPEVREIKYAGKILIIAPETAKWIVLSNEPQLVFFRLLNSGLKIEEALREFDGNIEDAKEVVKQLEARHFESSPPIPRRYKTMHAYLTNLCNLHCPHCYMNAGKSYGKELETQDWIKVLKEFKNIGGDLITFSGGEFTVRKDFMQILEAAHEYGLKIHLLSNGTLWTPELIKKVSSWINRVQISVDGFSEAENSKIRGIGSFDKALETVDEFVKSGVMTEIAVTPLFSKHLDSLYSSYVDFGKKLKAKYKDMPFAIKFNGEMLDGRNLRFSDEDRKNFAAFTSSISIAVHGLYSMDDGFVQMQLNEELKDGCAFGNYTIAANGDVFLCSLIQLLKPIGNVLKNNWNELEYQSKIAIKMSNVNSIHPCSLCELKYICGGDCRIFHFSQFRDNSYTHSIPTRRCSRKEKENFYDMMIRTNPRLFKE